MNLKEKTYLLYIVILRFWIGYYFLQQGIRKYLRDFPNSDWIGRQRGRFFILPVDPIGNLEQYFFEPLAGLDDGFSGGIANRSVFAGRIVEK